MKSIPIPEEKPEHLNEYRNFEEFNCLSDAQILEIDEFLKSYAALKYNCLPKMMKRKTQK
jgi:hypothetical protein